jgi:hypothetical protein
MRITEKTSVATHDRPCLVAISVTVNAEVAK